MFDLVTWLAMIGAILFHTLAAIFFKISAQQNSRRRILSYFVLGNAIGFFNPLCLTIAMSGNNPNLVIAMLGVLGGVFFNAVLNWVFKVGMTRRQWAAILIMIAGGVMLRASTPSDEAEGKSPPTESSRSSYDGLPSPSMDGFGNPSYNYASPLLVGWPSEADHIRRPRRAIVLTTFAEVRYYNLASYSWGAA